jgi:predicted amidohydrolase
LPSWATIPVDWRWLQPLSEQCSRFLVTMARRYQVALLGGGFPVPAGDGAQTLNRSELVDRDGQLLAQYDKIHLV